MYYINIIHDDGTSEKIELQQGQVYCKCSICGQKYAPPLIDFSRQFESDKERFLWTDCPVCIEKRREEQELQQRYNRHAILAKELSRYFKKDITPDEITQFVEENMDAGSNSWTRTLERFGLAEPANDQAPRKPPIAKRGKTVTVIPAKKPVV